MAKASSFTTVSVILNMSKEEAVALRILLEQQTPPNIMTATQDAFIVDIYHALKFEGVKTDGHSNNR